MSPPDPSKLDNRQILQGAYDEAAGRIRTDSTATIMNADIEVAIDYQTDSIVIKDPGGDTLQINPDGSINTTVETNLVASTPIIVNSNLAVTGIEYPVVLPLNTKKFIVKSTLSTAIVTMGFVSAGPVLTIPKGCSYTIDGILLLAGNRTIYLISNTNATPIEIVSWV